MKKLILCLMFFYSLSIVAQDNDIRISINGVIGGTNLYTDGVLIDDFNTTILAPHIILDNGKFLLGASYKSAIYNGGGPYYFKTDHNYLWMNVGYELMNNTFLHLNIGSRVTIASSSFGTQDPFYMACTGLGIIYFSSNHRYTIGTDFKIYNETYTKPRINPSLTIGLNFTTADFKKFINFIK